MNDQDWFADGAELAESPIQTDLLDVSELQRELGRIRVMYETAMSQYETLYTRSKATTEKLSEEKNELAERLIQVESEKNAEQNQNAELTRKLSEIESEINSNAASRASDSAQATQDLDQWRTISAYLRINSERAVSVLPSSVQNLAEIQTLLLQCSDQLGKASDQSGVVQAARILAHRIQSEAKVLENLLILFRNN